MEINTTFTISLTVNGRPYTYNIVAATKEEAMEILKGDLLETISELNIG